MSNNKYKVLIVDDEANIRSFIGAILESNGYQVLTAATCAQGQMMFASHRPDLILLDLGLPDEDGSALIRTVRGRGSPAPVLVLSARSDEAEKITALDLGANDYITKPFSVVEVLARVKANIRRTTEYAAPIQEPEELTFRCLKMDLSNHTVTKNGVLLELTAKEFDILKLLLQNPKRVYTKAQIYSLIWNDVYVGDENAVNVHISRLRNKIEDNPRSPECVLTVWGIGYKIGRAHV